MKRWLVFTPVLAAHFTREMDRMWQGAEAWESPRGCQRKLEREAPEPAAANQRAFGAHRPVAAT